MELTRRSCITKFVLVSKRNVTITMDEETARWARVEAARQDTSVSQWIGDLLRRHRERGEAYEAARRAFRRTPPRPLKREGGYPSRDELHDRSSE